ncbi:TPA: hypothetical protein ACYRMS_003720, partial [Proteus mirabilis]
LSISNVQAGEITFPKNFAVPCHQTLSDGIYLSNTAPLAYVEKILVKNNNIMIFLNIDFGLK